MRKSRSKSIFSGLFVVAIFGAGFFLCCWGLIIFVPQITLGQIIQSIMIFLVFWTTNRYYARVHDRRKKRIEILVNLVGDILVSVEKSHKIFATNANGKKITRLDRFHLDSALREHSNSVKVLEDVLEFSVHRDEVSDSLAQVMNDRSQYKELVTETPYPIRLPEDRVVHESTLFSHTRSNLVRLQLAISELE